MKRGIFTPDEAKPMVIWNRIQLERDSIKVLMSIKMKRKRVFKSRLKIRR
jgi:hypothetical protein